MSLSGKEKSRIILISVVTIVVVALIAVIAVITSRAFDEGKKKKERSEVVTVQRSVTHKTEEQDKKDAIKSLTEILNLAYISPVGMNNSQRMDKVEKGDFSVMDKRLNGKIRFPKDTNDALKINTYQSLIVISSVIKKNNPQLRLDPDAASVSFSDQEIGIVYVPVAVFTGPGAKISFEMVYFEGAWQLAPYHLVDSIKLSAKSTPR